MIYGREVVHSKRGRVVKQPTKKAGEVR